MNAYETKGVDQRNAAYLEMAQIIKDNTESTDKISSYWNWDEMYLLSERESASKYSYQSAAILDHQVYYDYVQDLIDNNAKIVTVMLHHFHFGTFGGYWHDSEFKTFLDERYTEIWRGSDKDANEYAVYKLKDEFWINS